MIYKGYFGPRPTFGHGFKSKTAVKQLIIINVVVFFISFFLPRPKAYRLFLEIFSVVPVDIIHKFHVWQLLTYMFLHGGVFHIFFNMLILFFLGRHVEASIGKKGFLKLYFTAGIGAGLIHVLTSMDSAVPMLGASGAVFGVMMAFAMLAPEQPITLLVMFILPITVKAKYLVLGLALIEFFRPINKNPSPSDTAIVMN